MGYLFSGVFSNFCYAANCYLRKKIQVTGARGVPQRTSSAVICGLDPENLKSVGIGAYMEALLIWWDSSHEITLSTGI